MFPKGPPFIFWYFATQWMLKKPKRPPCTFFGIMRLFKILIFCFFLKFFKMSPSTNWIFKIPKWSPFTILKPLYAFWAFGRSLFLFQMMRLVLEWPNEKVELELIAVCINLACNVKNAKLICDNKGLRLLMKRAFKFKDSSILKMIRNISQHPSLKARFVVSKTLSQQPQSCGRLSHHQKQKLRKLLTN